MYPILRNAFFLFDEDFIPHEPNGAQGFGTAAATGSASAVGAQISAATASATVTSSATGYSVAGAESKGMRPVPGRYSYILVDTIDEEQPGEGAGGNVGTATGTSTASAVGSILRSSSASASGTSTAFGVSAAGTSGHASGVSSAAGIGRSTAASVASALGRGTASGVSLASTAPSDDAHILCWLTDPDNYLKFAPITATSQRSSFPITNTTVLPVTRVWKSTTAAVQRIDIDLMDANNPVDVVALVHHNLTDDATVLVSAGSTGATGEYNISITWREFLAFIRLSTPQRYRYWSITITDTGNPDGFIKVGYIAIGLLVKPDFNFRYGWTNSNTFDPQEIQSAYGVMNIAGRSRRQGLNLNFGPIVEEQIELLNDMYTQIKRNWKPLLLIPERGGTDAYFGRIENMLEERVETFRYTGIAFIEDGYGRNLGG